MKTNIRRIFYTLTLALCITTTAGAQSFTQHLQEKKQAKGSVTVTQSKEIEDLVNKADVSAAKQEQQHVTKKPTEHADSSKTRHEAQTPHKNETLKHEPDSAKHHDADSSKHHDAKEHHEAQPPKEHHEAQPPKEHHEAQPPKEKHEQTQPETKTEEPYVDTSKKVMRRSYKVNGYRVQVFAGGNSRADKQKAQQAGNAVKRAMPDQPVYVHFYSPRWICRVGNYRSYQEANRVLSQVKKLGYRQACIVSGKINVAY